jgi:hypothetical protein
MIVSWMECSGPGGNCGLSGLNLAEICHFRPGRLKLGPNWVVGNWYLICLLRELQMRFSLLQNLVLV